MQYILPHNQIVRLAKHYCVHPSDPDSSHAAIAYPSQRLPLGIASLYLPSHCDIGYTTQNYHLTSGLPPTNTRSSSSGPKYPYPSCRERCLYFSTTSATRR